MLLKSLIFVFISLLCTEGSNILGIFPIVKGSHFILASKLMKGLLEAGHDVTMISAHELQDPSRNGKYTPVVIENLEEEMQKLMGNFDMFAMEQQNPIELFKAMTDMMVTISNLTFHDRKVKDLLQSDSQFDVVIMEQFMNDALKIFAHIYDCPLICLSSMGPNAWINPTVGNPQPVSYVPNILMRNFSPDSILDRAKNALFYIVDYLVNTFYILPSYEKVMREAFPNAPPLYDLYTNVSLILLNSHTSLYTAVPIVPNMVEIGGYFIDPPQKLPKDLQDFLDSAKDGVIYFSMGSNLKSKDMAKEKKEALLNAFGKLKQKVLWKFEKDLPEKPSNVMIRDWLPQQDILAHPNIKLFITHGGLLSTTETIYHGVPILAIPVFGDQPLNAEKAVTSGFGLKLEYDDPEFSEDKLSSLINELLNNSKYKENAQMRSKLYHDRPQKPMETAVYWVEYVVRHKGAPHLRVAGVRMPWYQYFMVDVIGALILSIFVVIYTIKLVFKKVFCRNKNSNESNKIKTN